MKFEKIIIRNANKEDFPAIVELWKEMMDFHAQRDSFFTRASDGDKKFKEFLHTILQEKDTSLLLVAEISESNQIVGYTLGKLDNYPPVFQIKQYGSIYDMAVSSSFRRKRIGEKLFTKALEWFKIKGIKRLELRVATSNEISPLFWEQMGFIGYMMSMYFTL